MFDAPFRRRFAVAMQRPVSWFVRRGITPIQCTVAAMVLGVSAGVMVGVGRPYIGLTLWIGSRILDGLDGLVARAQGQASAFGGYLDITLDMVSYSVMLLGFARVHPQAMAAWLAILTGYVLVTTSTLALSSALESMARHGGDDRSLQFTPGLAEAGETTVVYTLFVLAPQWTNAVAWIWAAMCGVTVVQRTLLARRLLREHAPQA